MHQVTPVQIGSAVAVKRRPSCAVRLLVPRRFLNIVAALSLLLFVADGGLCVAAHVSRPWVVTRGTIAGGKGFANSPAYMVFWAGDLTGMKSRAAMDEWSFPGVLFRRVHGPQASNSLFVAHWLVLLVAGALPFALLTARWVARRRGTRVGFDLSAPSGGFGGPGQADRATGATAETASVDAALSRANRGSS